MGQEIELETIGAIDSDLGAFIEPLDGGQCHGASVVRLDPALDQVISAGARLAVLKTDYFGISEGPVWVRQDKTGYLLFSDIGANVIYKWTPEGIMSVYLEKSGYTGDPAAIGLQGFMASNGRLNIGNFGSNGIVSGSARRAPLMRPGRPSDCPNRQGRQT